MKTRLRILNLVIVAVCGLAVWQMRANHIEHQSRLDQTFSVQLPEAQAAELAIDPLPAAPPAAEYSEIAMRMLFAQDRNPNVVEEKPPAPEPKKRPDLPVLLGIMNLGDGNEAMMSETAGGAQASYKDGDTIGEFKIVKIASDRITFEWDGKEFTKTAAELRGSGASPAPRKAKSAAETPVAAKAPPPPPATPVKPGRGKDLGGGNHACVDGDNSPEGTVVDGYVKRYASTPFGKVCNWQPVKQ
jgi:hypothetical protein